MERLGRDNVSTLRDYVRVLRMRKWIVVFVAIALPASAVVVSLQQEKLYEASADVLVTNRNLAVTLSGLPEAYEDPERHIRTQVDLARVPRVADRVRREAGVDVAPGELLANSSVVAKEGSDLLTFSVQDPDPERAALLATEYARQFTRYRRELDTAAVSRTRSEIERRLQQLGEPTSKESPRYDTYVNLLERSYQLRTLEQLQTSNAALVREANSADQIQPRPLRNGVLGFGLGLLFGIGLAFLRHALDTRVHSAEEIGGALGLPLLARLPTPPRQLRRRGKPSVVAEPSGYVAEAFRVLRTNLEFANLERGAKSIIFTSAVEGEGKSTSVVNLAAAFARLGRRVVVVDLDLRRPSLDEFFDLADQPGVTDVVLGHVTTDEAIASIPIGGADATSRENGNRADAFEATLDVLCAGSAPPNPGEFIGSRGLADVLATLERRWEFVFVDAPPLLHVGDAMVLSAKVDALVLVTRMNVIRRPMLHELGRVLETCPAAKLGFVLTGVEAGDGYGYGAYYYYAPRAARGKPRERAL
jgi:succinoglycan biosynthesis transport protein ExoP